ncbi:hypothetical protein OROHE_008650 [Orobanche hederae]
MSFFCYRHDEICEQVESVLRLLDPNYSFPHVEDEKKNKQEDEQPGMDLTLVFEEENKEEAEEVQEEPQEEPHKSKSKNKNKRKKQEDEQLDMDSLCFGKENKEEEEVQLQQVDGKVENLQESHKKSKNKNKQKDKNNKKKKKQQKKNMEEVDYSNIRKNREHEKKNDAIIIKYGPWNILEGIKYDLIPLIFSKLRDYLIKYIGHLLRVKLEEESSKNRKKKNKKKMQQQQQKNDAKIIKYQSPPENVPWNIQEGEKYDVKALLFSKLRDYLIKCNGHQVKCQQLKEKYILLYFWWLSDDISTFHKGGICSSLDEYLGEIYRANNPKGNFEVVYVALGNNKRAFHDSFSCMPWLAIPHEDQEGRDLFIKIFDIPSSPSVRAVLFAPDGTALSKNAVYTFCSYGPDGFPFTKRSIRKMHREHDALLKEFILKKQKKPLNLLLGDYLITSEEKQVCTSVLEDKIVGLYFFGTSPMDFQSAEKLLNIWKFMRTSEAYSNFEIVLVHKVYDGNLPLAKARFKDKFGDIPWYSLPLTYNKKCCHVFWLDFVWKTKESVFIVLEPDRYQRLSYFAFGILDKFGIDAYPFTLEKAVIIEKSIQRKQLVLSQLLSPLAPLRRGGSTCNNEEDTTVSMLSGKRILLLFAMHSCYECGPFLSKLKKMYDESKGTDDHFEVIYISLDCVETPYSFPRGIQRMPWLIHSYAPRFAEDLAKRVFPVFPRLPAIAAFGPDGHLETKESN